MLGRDGPASVPDKVDLVFTCPPYYNLEVYSDAEGDISNAPTYGHFLGSLKGLMFAAFKRLKENRFAVVVMGDLRAPTGYQYGLIDDTVSLAHDLGLQLYNEAILVTPVGTLPVRTGRTFAVSRKLGRAHQHVLVFYKGDPAKIKMHFDTTIELADVSGLEPEVENE